jgi:predicted phosphodiesterase
MGDKVNETILVIPDLHFPYEVRRAVQSCVRFGEQLKPDRVVLIGDVVDFYAVSRFDKNPLRKERLKDELHSAKEFFDYMQSTIPGKPKYDMLEGNHEDRLRKYLWRNAPEIADLGGTSVPELLGLASRGITWHPGTSPLHLGPLTLMHGNRIRKLGGATAKAISDEREQTIICGHSHRQGWVPHTSAAGLRGGYEMGCLCDYRKLDYVDSVPNWQLGWGVVTLLGRNAYNVEFARVLPVGKTRKHVVTWRNTIVDGFNI